MIILSGYDNRNIIYDAGDYILRKIEKNYFHEIEKIYNIYEMFSLEKNGIVKTEIIKSENCFKHKKHVITYPYEWAANMYKDAVLFHLSLITALDPYGLTLKDSLPNNILFDCCTPVFVDFASLVRTEKLCEEKWLIEGNHLLDPRFVVVEKMFIPFMLIPFVAMLKKKHSLARRILAEQACNCDASAPAWKNIGLDSLFKIATVSPLRNILDLFVNIFSEEDKLIAKILLLIGRKKIHFIDFIRELSQMIIEANIAPRQSAYLSYYENKKEKFDFEDDSFWNNKQKNVHEILSTFKPSTVLDIGANTGWFSILAAKIGANVIATDIDESCINSLYLFAKRERLRLLPLVLSFDELTREIYGVENDDPCYAGRDFKATPLFLPATRRLKVELVLCLGLIHHLVLGMGKKIGDVMEVLSELSDKQVILEFVSIEDELIMEEPSFFKCIDRYTVDNYNINLAIGEAKKIFRIVKILNSGTDTRKLLFLEK